MPRLTKDRSDNMAKLAKLLQGLSDDRLKLVLLFAVFLKEQDKKRG
ncbi:hypothetical protein ES707_07383 [subsurface metagenome]